jgi:hypothetical protein
VKARLTEKAFQTQVVQLARLCGFETYHTFDSRRSDRGFPDLVLLNPKRGRLVFAELKVARGKTTPEQDVWLANLRAAGQEVYLWRPADWDEIQVVLTGGES